MKFRDNTNPNHVIFIMFILVFLPTIEIILFTNIIPGILQIISYFYILASITGVYIIYIFIEQRKYFRIGMSLIIPLLIAIIILTFRDQHNLGNIVYFKKNEIELNDFVKEIRKHPEIKNFYGGDSYEDIVEKYNIDKSTYADFKKRLKRVGAICFETSDANNSIAFICDGFNAHRNGVMYYEGKDKVYGAMLWTNVADNWYIWGD